MLEIKFLGTSSFDAIPREDCQCGQCLSLDKKDKRKRSAILVNKKILVDAGPDIAKQLSQVQIKNLKMVLITHDHQDHIEGLKDLLKINPLLNVVRLSPGQYFKFNKLDFHAFKVKHSNQIITVGIEIGPVVYIPDMAEIDWAIKYLKESKVAILDGSVLGQDFGGHLAIETIIKETKDLKNLKMIYFTHNGHTKKNHLEMVRIVKALGGRRYDIAYDGLKLAV